MAVTDVTVIIGGLDLSSKILTYAVRREITPSKVVTTMDGVEHAVLYSRDVVSFTLMPMTDAEATELYRKLNSLTASFSSLNVYYTSPYQNGAVVGARFRLAGDLEAVFGLKAASNGSRFYKGGTITLRRRDVYASSQL